MDEVAIKNEFDSDTHLQCRSCLSFGRQFIPLEELKDIYSRITWDIFYTRSAEETLRICWECVALLRRVHRFRCQAKKANEILELGQGSLYGSLSNLTTVVLNDTNIHSIYIHEAIIEKKEIENLSVKCNPFNDKDNWVNDDVKSLNDNDNSLNDNDNSLNDTYNSLNDNYNPANDSVKDETETCTKRKNENKWAKKRVLQNKRPKFKILTSRDINFDETFVKVKINEEESRKCLQSCDGKYIKSRCKYEKSEKSFSEEKISFEHMKQIPLKFICDICKSSFVNKRHLAEHISDHYFKYTCSICAYTCHDKTQAGRHFENEHRKIYECLKCKLKFRSRRDFFKHFKEWHENYICDYCGISFKMRYCIKNHIRKQHSPYECKLCNKRFSRYNGLWLHNKTRHTKNQAAYCVECDKQYADVYRYKWHLANSTRHTPRAKLRVPCPDCGKVFSKNIYMKDHHNLVHLKFYKYRCEQCDKNFIRNADLMKHKRKIHDGILPPKDKICYMCGRGFSSNKILSNHLRTHTGERPFACGRCGATFAQNTTLVAHTRALHTNS